MNLTSEQWAATIRQMKGARRIAFEAPHPAYFTSIGGAKIIQDGLDRASCEMMAQASCHRDYMTYQRCVKVLHQVRSGAMDPKTGAGHMRRLLAFPLPFLGAIVKVEGQTFRSHPMEVQHEIRKEIAKVIDPDTGIAVMVYALTGSDLDAHDRTSPLALDHGGTGSPFVFGPTHRMKASASGGYFGTWWAYKLTDGALCKWDQQWHSEADAVAAVALIIKEEQAETAEGSV